MQNKPSSNLFFQLLGGLFLLFLSLSINAQKTEQTYLDSIDKYKYSSPDKAKKLIDESFKKFPSDSNQLNLYRRLGDYYWYKALLDSSIANYKNALNLAIKSNNKKQEAGLNNDIGYLYMEKSNYNKSLEYYSKAQKLSNKYNIESTKILSATYMGLVYSRLKDSANALQYQKQALQLYINDKDESGEATILNNIGSTYFNSDDYSNAIKYYLKSSALDKKLNNLINYYQTQNNIGICYTRLKDYDNAINYFSIATKGLIELNNKKSLIHTYFFLSNIYYQKKDFKKSEEYEKKFYEIFNQTKDTIALMNYKGSRAPLQAANGDFKNAYYNSFAYYSYKDSINELMHKKSLVEQQVEFDVNKKQNEIDLLNKDNKLKENEAKKNQIILYFLLGFSALMIVTVYISIRSYINKRKANNLITQQHQEVTKQKDIIEEHQKEILDSIHYAKRIQNTIITHTEFIDANIPNNFIFFHPKDIVSGDFYWATKKDSYFYFAVCDSTGHGVPGAFMSLLNIGFLSEAINEKNISSPDKIFDYVREKLIAGMSKEGQKDGFDGTLLKIKYENNKLLIEYASANNKPILIKNSEILELEADRMAVGYGEKKDNFKLYQLELEPNETLYLYTDGFADQFGGPKGKKFKYKQLNEFLRDISKQDLHTQKEMLQLRFNEWKGNLEQVDDVCVVCIKTS